MPRYRIEIEPEPDYTWVLALIIILAAIFYSLLRPVFIIIIVAVFIALVWWLVRRIDKGGDEE